MSAIATAAPLLEVRGATKSFPGVKALRGVDLDLHAGEVLALMGENGAGKSTLIKILGGAQRPDEGSLKIGGVETVLDSPIRAQKAGIGVIYQELNLIPALTARENIFLGRERCTGGFIHAGDEERIAKELFTRLGVNIPLNVPCRRLSVAEQRVVEIAKALSLDARILIMDEPTAALAQHEVDGLLALVRDLKSQGIGIIYVSHRMDEIHAIADRIMVMRDGQHVGTSPAKELNREQLIERMVGRKLEAEFPTRQRNIGEPRLVVRGLKRGKRVLDVSFEVRRGEILALAGLMGAGRTETVRLLFGADRREAGTITLDGKELDIRSPADAIKAGIGLLPEDRKQQGLVLGQSVLENFGLPNLSLLSRVGVIRRGQERRAFEKYVEQLKIRVPHVGQIARFLSGGNQQKVVLAKWLYRGLDVLIFDEPTRGIDVGAKYEIYVLIHELAAQGKAIIFISSELPEVLGMADRILVMHEGKIRGEITDVAHATQEQIIGLTVP